jgi:hypothetical protein
MGKLRREKWNGVLPKNMRTIIAEVRYSFAYILV